MPDAVNQLLATEAALDKLGARGMSVAEAGQTTWNRHVIVRNRRGNPKRRQPEARTLVIEETIEPTTWLLITGWDSTAAERKILERS